MIKCPFCSSVYPENTLFCDECGSYLVPSSDQGTDPLQGQTIGEVKQGEPNDVSFLTLVLDIQDGGSIELPLSKEVVLGRLDAGRAVFPDVDLTSEQ